MANVQSTTAKKSSPEAFVVVSWWQDRIPGRSSTGKYEYEHCDDLNEASRLYAEYETGEHSRASAVGIFPAKNGMPAGEQLEPYRVAMLTSEMLAA